MWVVWMYECGCRGYFEGFLSVQSDAKGTALWGTRCLNKVKGGVYGEWMRKRKIAQGTSNLVLVDLILCGDGSNSSGSSHWKTISWIILLVFISRFCEFVSNSLLYLKRFMQVHISYLDIIFVTIERQKINWKYWKNNLYLCINIFLSFSMV